MSSFIFSPYKRGVDLPILDHLLVAYRDRISFIIFYSFKSYSIITFYFSYMDPDELTTWLNE